MDEIKNEDKIEITNEVSEEEIENKEEIKLVFDDVEKPFRIRITEEKKLFDVMREGYWYNLCDEKEIEILQQKYEENKELFVVENYILTETQKKEQEKQQKLLLEKERMIKKYEVFKSYLPRFLDYVDEIQLILDRVLNQQEKKILAPLKKEMIEFYKEVKSIK